MFFCGKFILFLCRNIFDVMAINFIGEYDCKVDAKGRIMLPVNFRRKLGEVEPYLFVVKNDIYEQFLELYTMETWEEEINRIHEKINPFDRDDKQVLRDFRMGATEVECDPSGRILIPSRLLKRADIKTDTVLIGGEGKIEIWSPELLEKNRAYFAARSEERFARILGNTANKT